MINRDSFYLLNWLLVATACLGGVLLRIRQKRSAAKAEDGPVLSSEDMLGVGGLTSLSQGMLAGFSYNLMTDNSGRVMLLLQLGHDTLSHIVAYGDKSRVSSITSSLISKNWLEPVVLEGDFPEYFHMYCNPELQDTVRELFTPDVVEDFVNFCRAYDFELFHETLYISKAAAAQDEADQTTLVTDVTQLLTKQDSLLRRLAP